MVLGSDGILRMSQMQSYWTYKMTIDISSLPDPSLAPKVTSFNLVAEPNRYKQIDIPLYRTGTIEGMAIINKNGEKQGIGGLRLLLKKVGSKDFLETIRTFSDGGFYTFSLLPGKYTLEIDPAQLDFLQARIVQEVLEFEIKALSEGDYIEGLNFELNPISEELAVDIAEISDPESEESEEVENEAATAEETPEVYSDSELGYSKISIVIEKEEVPYYYVIVASSPDKTLARIEAQKFMDKGKAVWVIFPKDETENYRIALGKYKDYKSAAKALEKAKIESAETSWILKY